MKNSVKYRPYKVKTISVTPVIQHSEFNGEFIKCFMGLMKVTCGDLVLVNDSDAINELAKVFPVHAGKDTIK